MPELEFSFDTILDEHRQLRRQVEDLKTFLKAPRPEPGRQEARSWGSHLAGRLLELHDLLCTHFRAEEDSGALDELARRHPWAFESIRKLQADHEHILEELRAILGAAMVYAEGKTPASPHLRRWTATVLDALVRHEQQESDLIARAVAPTEREEALEEELDRYAGVPPELGVDALTVPLRTVGWQPAPALPVGSSVDQALKLMLQGGTSCIVVKSGEALAGLITERDMLARVVGKVADLAHTRVEDVMTRELFTLRPDEPLVHALALMDTGGFRHVLVAESGRLHGVLTTRAILRYLTGLLPEELRVLPAGRMPRERDGA